ncbi:MAG: hypothetical protein WD025_05965 [Bacteriovoracaceae bacterium]
MQVDKTKLETYLARLEELESEDMMKLVEKHLNDDSVELICQHIEDFYGIEDDEEIGHLAQLMVAGFVMGREVS